MNTSKSAAFWTTVSAANEISLHPTDPQIVFAVAVAHAILTAALTGVRTATISTSGVLSEVVQYVTASLNQGSYQAHVTGTNLIINW